MTESKATEGYVKPELVRHDNLKEITFSCPSWGCSITVPGAPF